MENSELDGSEKALDSLRADLLIAKGSIPKGVALSMSPSFFLGSCMMSYRVERKFKSSDAK